MFAALWQLQQEALAILDLQGPVALDELEAFLKERRDLEREEGEKLTLRYPGGSLLVYRGYYTAQQSASDSRRILAALHALLQHEDRSYEQAEELLEEFAGWRQIFRMRQPLARIVELQKEVSSATACTPEAALAFLLCDVVPDLPFVTVGVRGAWRQGRSRTGEGPIQITVGSPRAPVTAVAAAYSGFLAIGLPSGYEMNAPRAESPFIAVAFVRQYRARAAGPSTPRPSRAGSTWPSRRRCCR